MKFPEKFAPLSLLLLFSLLSLLLLPAEAAAQSDEGVPFIAAHRSDSVTFAGATGLLGATLTLPAELPEGGAPAVLMISGSGTQDRDMTVGPYRFFAFLAEWLASRGVASLRVDDPGSGVSVYDPALTAGRQQLPLLTANADSALRFLRSRPGVDPARTGLMGHSLGAVTAFSLAAAHPDDVAFIISLAGYVCDGRAMLVRQNELMMEAAGVLMMPRIHDTLVGLFETVATGTPEEVRRAVEQSGPALGVSPLAYDAQIAALTDPAYVELVRFDPAADFARVSCPVLMLGGDMDLQVDSEMNFELARTLSPRVRTQLLPGVNHLMQEVGSVREGLSYAAPGRSFSTAMLRAAAEFLSRVTRQRVRG